MSDKNKGSIVIFLCGLLLTLVSCSTTRNTVSKPKIPEKVSEEQKILYKYREKVELFMEAKEAFEKGDYKRCNSLLVEERRFPLSFRSKLKNLYLSGLCQLKLENTYKAKYFLKRVIALSENPKIRMDRHNGIAELVGKTYLTLGLVFYREKLYAQSLSYMTGAVKKYREVLTESELSKAYLRMSDVLYYRRRKIYLARFYFKKIDLSLLAEKEKKLYSMLKEELKWQNIRLSDLGIADENISVLTFDGNDLWIGTWNGGLARYNMYRNETKVFKVGKSSIAPKTIRAIKVVRQNVWVGSYEGLSYYSKRSGKWHRIDAFSGSNKTSVEAIESVGNRVYVGTLGRGLWELNLEFSGSKGWKRVDKDGSLKFVNCLSVHKKYLIIGTMDKGLFFFNVTTGKLINLAEICSGFKPVNITTILVENDNSLWIGTYGKGLFNWNSRTNTLRIFTKENGLLSDNWVLAGGKGKDFLYFGTFGGGALAFDRLKRLFKFFTLKDGLDSMDVSSVAVSNGLVAFGTLGMGISLYFGESN